MCDRLEGYKDTDLASLKLCLYKPVIIDNLYHKNENANV